MPWSQEMRIWVIVVDCITLITGLPANLLAFYTFIRKIKQSATPLDVLLLNLNISDLVFLFFLPFRTHEAVNARWNLRYFLCPLSGFVFYSTFHNSILLLTAIGVERYLGVAFPIKYKIKRRPRNAVIASIFFWLISMGHCSIVFVMQYYRHNDTELDSFNSDTCYRNFSEEQLKILVPFRLELGIVLFFIPFTISCFCYINFIIILLRLPNLKPKKRFRAIGLSVVTFLVFVICFMPLNVSQVTGYINNDSAEWRTYAVIPSTLNASMDPFIFYFSSSALRENFKRLLRELANRLHLSSLRNALCSKCDSPGTEEKQSMDSSRDNQLQTSTDF